MRNAALEALPQQIEGYGRVRPFTGAFDNLGLVEKASVRLSSAVPGESRLVPCIAPEGGPQDLLQPLQFRPIPAAFDRRLAPAQEECSHRMPLPRDFVRADRLR